MLPTLKHDFELRRLIFGLSAIVGTPPGAMPAAIAEKLPFVMRELASVCGKMREERLKVLKDNEEHLAEEAKKRAGKGAKEEEEEEDEGDGFVDDDEDEEEEDNEQAVMNKLRKFREKGAVLEGGKADEEDEDDDDEDDSDYEYTGGEMAIYDSALDDVDELLFVREALEKLNAADAAYTSQLLSAIDSEKLIAFNETMRTAQELKDREEVIRKQCDELDEQTGGNMRKKIGDDLF